MPKLELLGFARYCGNILEVWWKYYIDFVVNLLLLRAMKKF